MIGGILLARENKRYLIGYLCPPELNHKLKIWSKTLKVVQLNSMKTMILGLMICYFLLEVTFETYVIESDNGVADEIDKLEMNYVNLYQNSLKIKFL